MSGAEGEPFDVRTVTGEWDYATLPANVALGERCWIERRESFERFRSERDRGVALGPGTQVYGWTVFNVEPEGCVEAGEDCVLVGAVFMCQERITLGRDVVVSYQVTIADSDFHPRDPDARRRDAEASAPHAQGLERPPIADGKPGRKQRRADAVDQEAGAAIQRAARNRAGPARHIGSVRRSRARPWRSATAPGSGSARSS